MAKEDFSHFDRVPVYGGNNFVAENATVIGHVITGKDVSIWYQAVLRADINSIVIGDGSNVQDGCVFHVSDRYGVNIGSNVVVGHHATVHACTIGNNCLVGMKSTILDGATVGNNCIIGAGAVVSMGAVIPDNCLVLGVPGKIKREVTKEESDYTTHLANKYIRLKDVYLKKFAK